jgi:hypothetical protein
MGVPTQGNPLGVDGTWPGNYQQPNDNNVGFYDPTTFMRPGCPFDSTTCVRVGSVDFPWRCPNCGRQYRWTVQGIIPQDTTGLYLQTNPNSIVASSPFEVNRPLPPIPQE